MKTKVPSILLMVFFVATLVLIALITGSREMSLPSMQMKLTQLTMALGGLMSLLSAALMLFRAAAGNTMAELVPLTLPLLGGILFFGFHWVVAAVLGLIAIAWIVREIVGTPAERRGAGSAPNSGTGDRAA